MDKSGYLLGIDVGTTNTKVAIYDAEGKRLAFGSFRTPLVASPYGENYRPEEIFRSLIGTIKSFDATLRKEIVALSVSSFAEVMVGIDARGKVVGDCIPWYDTRTEEQFEKMRNLLDPQHVYQITGLLPQNKYSFYKLFWHKEKEPERFEKTALWTSMSGYILYAFSGECSFDYSLASRTMFFDQRKLAWWEEGLSMLDLPVSKLAPLCPSGKAIGVVKNDVARELGFSDKVVVVTGGHDHLCAALACGVFEEGRALISTGTTESLTMIPSTIPRVEVSEFSKPFSWGQHVVFPRLYAMNGIYSGGYAVDWLLKITGKDYSLFEVLPLPPRDNIPLFLPYLLGAHYPGARAAFLGLSGDAGLEELFCGLVLGICFEYRKLWEGMETELKIKAEEASNVGGGTRNSFWMQLKADVLNREIAVPEDTEGSLKGAALLAGLGSGFYKSVDEAYRKTFRVKRKYYPRQEFLGWFDSYYSLYVELERDMFSLNQKILRKGEFRNG
ncbi:FGGY family carbohydrate kinase [Thermatribacter velox]|uniref:FGGY family carbohydrate kinase n=1 Tax=Thermatribacter velox TaxID=3039681 RepID=A0ABZ2YC28_9BACT